MDLPRKYYQKDIASFLKNILPKGKSKSFIKPHETGFRKNFDYYIFNHTFSYVKDIQEVATTLLKKSKDESRIIVISFNFLWKPALNLATKLGLRSPDLREPNWLDKDDIKNIFYLAGFEQIKSGNRFLIPIDLGIISNFFNQYISQLPLINNLCLTTYQVFRKIPKPKKYSVSIIIPARNEEGNIKGVIKKIPKLHPKMEIIFVEGHSKDNTFNAIKNEVQKYKGKWKLKFLKQKGIGKADAVRIGLKLATNELFMILDADLSVNPSDLRKFYGAICLGRTEFANGSRLVYPIEGQAMRTLNYFGNKTFSVIFSYLLGQNIKDTLCGTKAILKSHYRQIERYRSYFGNFDPFGDYDLLFGSSRLNLKITDVPIRYHERKYGKTNISRFRHGLLLLKMTLVAAKKLKFI